MNPCVLLLLSSLFNTQAINPPYLDINPLDAKTTDQIKTQFITQNQIQSSAMVWVDEHSGLINRVINQMPPAQTTPSEKKAKKLVVDFLKKNHPFFGINQAQITHLDLTYSTNGSRTYVVVKSQPLSYPELINTSMENLAYKIVLLFQFNGDNIDTIDNRTRKIQLNGAHLDLNAAYDLSSQKILDQLSSAELKFEGLDGKEINLGFPTKGDISSAQLELIDRIVTYGSRDYQKWVGLAWVLEVRINNSGPFEFIFSAVTGELISVEQAFNT